jgi:transcriptional regulator with XRE-family HTH domain
MTEETNVVVRKVYSKAFGDHIKELRISKNWSVRAMGNILGVSHTYVNDLETGSRPAPPKDKLEILIKVFDIDNSTAELNHFLDLAAESRNAVPIDVEEFILQNPILIEFIRKIKNRQFINAEYIDKVLKTVKMD